MAPRGRPRHPLPPARSLPPRSPAPATEQQVQDDFRAMAITLPLPQEVARAAARAAAAAGPPSLGEISEREEEEEEEHEEEAGPSKAEQQEQEEEKEEKGPIKPENGEPAGGEHDQTGGLQAQYELVTIDVTRGAQKGQKVTVTVDRSAVVVGRPEPHKLMVFTKTGWSQWPRAESMVWTDKQLVAAVNKWRDQNYRRAGLEYKRKQPRATYSNAELDFLFQFVKNASGGKPNQTMAVIQKRFNTQFGVERGDKAIESIVNRLKDEYKQNNGQRKARNPRGSNKVKEKAAKAAAASSSKTVAVDTDDEDRKGEYPIEEDDETEDSGEGDDEDYDDDDD